MTRVLNLIRMVAACWFGTILLLVAVNALSLPIYYILAYVEFIFIVTIYPTGSATQGRIRNVIVGGGVVAVVVVAYKSLTFAGVV